MWWDINHTLSYNCLFNFIIGNRGGGKTYGFKKWAVQDFLKTGSQFVYVRRYKQELKKISKFFDDVSTEFPDTKFEVKGYNFLIDDKLAGCAIPLSTAKIEKSVPFPTVNKICLDEFILDSGVYHYLPDEVTNFLELYETIARMRDNVTCFFLSNALTITNPYFMYFDITLPYGKNIARRDEILIELVANADYIEAKKRTRFASITKGTQYEKYAVENQFLRDNKNFVAKKTADAEYYFTLAYLGEHIGVWIDYKQGLIYVSNNVDPYCKLVYSVTADDHKPNTLLLKGARKSVFLKSFIDQYTQGSVRFESINLKNICYQIIKLCM